MSAALIPAGGIEHAHGAVLVQLHAGAASTFFDNVAIGRPFISTENGALGGGMDNEGGATVRDSLLTHNQAIGGSGPSGSGGKGGGIFNGSEQPGQGGNANLTVSHSVFTDNQALGGSGTTGPSGFGQGGAIANQNGGTVVIDQSTLTGNRALAGSSVSGYTGRGLGGGVFNTSDDDVFGDFPP